MATPEIPYLSDLSPAEKKGGLDTPMTSLPSVETLDFYTASCYYQNEKTKFSKTGTKETFTMKSCV